MKKILVISVKKGSQCHCPFGKGRQAKRRNSRTERGARRPRGRSARGQRSPFPDLPSRRRSKSRAGLHQCRRGGRGGRGAWPGQPMRRARRAPLPRAASAPPSPFLTRSPRGRLLLLLLPLPIGGWEACRRPTRGWWGEPSARAPRPLPTTPSASPPPGHC